MGVIAIMIAYQFMSIFSFSMDAIMQSFLLDEEMRRGIDASRPDDIQDFKEQLEARGGMCSCSSDKKADKRRD